MFALALIIGTYSYTIFALGILGFLYRELIVILTIVFVMMSFAYFRKKPEDFPRINLINKNIRPLLLLFIIMMAVNLVGVLGPELSFDALWYHLTLPKIFLENNSINFIPGGLFYYSVMSKLTEMLYIGGLSFGSEVFPKLIHFAFGILTSIVVYKISRKYLDEKLSFLASLIFYGSLVVAWESITAYIDLSRAFFEVMALWGFIEYVESKNKKWLIESAVMTGLAVSTKLIALGSLPIFVLLIFLFEKNRSKAFRNGALFSVVTLLISFPWFFFSIMNTGNPFYPAFSGLYQIGLSPNLLNPVNFIKDFFVLFFEAGDPISPIFVILLPLTFVYIRKFTKNQKIVVLYSIFALLVWYITPRTGGGRFILPYLPAFSILTAFIISKIDNKLLKQYVGFLILFICLITIAYRGVANLKYLPVVLGVQSKNEFLSRNLNFNFGDFYDTDGYFTKNIRSGDKVLLYGFHNLFYANFPFIHESFVKTGDRFNYIAIQNANLPERFSHWNLIYENDKTNVRLYSLGGMRWTY